MTEADDNPAAAPPAPPSEKGWSQVWQLPVLLVGLGLFILAVYSIVPSEAKDDFPAALDSVAATIMAEDTATAQKLLEELQPQMTRATQSDQARHEELWGDLVFTQQKIRGVEAAVDHELMLGYYRQSTDLGRPPDDARLQRMAESLVALGREEQALDVLNRLRDAVPQRRYGVIRKLIEKRLATPDFDPVPVEKLLSRFLEESALEPDKAKQREAEIWGFTQKMELLSNAGGHAAVIDAIERKSISLMDRGGDKDLGPLEVLRGKAYLHTGKFKVAADVFREAMRRLPAGHALNADALVGLGQIELSQSDDVRPALQYFKQAMENFQSQSGDLASSPYLEALLGRADCEARTGQHAEALQYLTQAVKVLTDSRKPPKAKSDRLIDIALTHHVAATDQEQHEIALAYLSALTPLHGESIPPNWWVLFAATHDRIAVKMLRDAGLPLPMDGPSPGGGAIDAEKTAAAPRAAEAIRLIRQEAARHFERAGDSYGKHAAGVKADDPKAAADSLWAAAAAYDNAFQWKQAVRAYESFIDLGAIDPRSVDAVHRIGIAHLADKKYALAAEQFESLRKSHPTHKATLMSLVPLSSALMALSKFDEAAKVLTEVVINHPAITPESDEYRDALISLGRLYHQRKDFENAIQRLTMAVDRYGETRAGATLRFLLAESYRQSIPMIDKSLEEPLPQSKTREYQAERVRRLEQALILHSQVVTQLGEIEEQKLPPIELLYFRNAYFYRADCAFDLKRFEQAIELYDAAARRWRDHPSSLVALVQMVNAYAELGQHQNARAVNLRARDHLRRIPEEAFNDPSLPMTRKHWQDWLHWSSKLDLFDPQASADPK